MKKLALAAVGALSVATLSAPSASAQAYDAYTGDVILVGFTFCPAGWTETNGQILAISSNPALYSLLGTNYGGNGISTFGLPDLRGRIPVHVGTGPGLMPVYQGQMFGSESRALYSSNLPAHSHALYGNEDGTDLVSPAGAALTVFTTPGAVAYQTPPNTAMDDDQVGDTGFNQSFDLWSPFTTLRYCIKESGLYPPRN